MLIVDMIDNVTEYSDYIENCRRKGELTGKGEVVMCTCVCVCRGGGVQIKPNNSCLNSTILL